MVALDLLEQQRADEVLRLEIACSNLSKAFASGEKSRMHKAITTTILECPRYAEALQKGMDEIFFEHYGHKFTKDRWDKISTHCMKLNVKGCMRTLVGAIGEAGFYANNYTYAQNILYQPNRTFWQDEVLHQSSQGQQLTVADLLAVSKYAVSVAEAIDPDNERFAKANAAITVFQGIDAILNNKPEDKPVNKMLHLATSFLSSVVKSSLKDSDAKQDVTITTIMVDLAIDFFCRK